MILNETKPYSESHGVLDEKFFGVADLGMIFGILRSKLYSNPILAVCREISCNARDAMREAGRPNEPITIHLPTRLEPTYSIKDTGVGISPDRMENVFINYASSTKRNDNIQTGGWGLGCKTPWAVSTDFSITTIYNGIKYSYSCFIDETKVGKLALLSKITTDLPNSTEISIPVKPADFSLFKQYTQQACDHWDIKPQILGGDITWSVFTPVLQGSNWSIVPSNDHYSKGTTQLIIDGIPYSLDMTALRKYADSKLIEATCGTLYMKFGIGEISLSANREQVFLDQRTQDKLAQRLNDITTEVKAIVQSKIDSYSNLFAANVFYRKELASAFNNFSFLGKLQWKGCDLSGSSHLKTGCPVYSFSKGNYSWRRNHDPNKITRSINHDLEFMEHSELFINDLSLQHPTPRHVKKAFDNNPSLKCVQVINPNDATTEEVLNKSIHLDQMAPQKLSSITKASTRKYTPATSRLLVFKSGRDGSWHQVSYDSIDEDTNVKVLCSLLRQEYPAAKRDAILSNKQQLNSRAIKALSDKFPSHSFYGVDNTTEAKRIKEDLSDLVSFEKFLDKNLFNDKTNYVEIKWAIKQSGHVDERFLRYLDKFEKLITNSSSLFLTRLYLHQKISRLNKENEGFLWLYEAVKGIISDASVKKFAADNPDMNADNINSVYCKRYPLIGMIHTYNYDSVIEHVAAYVNMIDERT